ncbi:hypothetical protein N7539_008093 [Penicillium diatomitis]|uniref:Hepatocellular carcinoma-associated antigen 59-domain-containing protein n=1 Tax=Penicillium diatomitis TaxID=2819901 RepID=A0A9W9WTW1_9EURO|nr:uncharacterized protein N7539_008093 [Penicillium diatomitis]KAJ5475027.1 hypothetical protein N7539_008093 [Penicillium diatomitis]
METEVDNIPQNLFRSAKRRKFARRRQDDDETPAGTATEPASENQANTSQTPEPNQRNESDEGTHTAGVVRMRRPKALHKGGIGFSATARPSSKTGDTQIALVPTEEQEKETIQAMADRFQTYTGQAEDVDKHMMAYIDAEMAKRFRRGPTTESASTERPEPKPVSEVTSAPGQPHERLPASLGKLHEIDLGQETKLQNIARTEAAARRLAGDETHEPNQSIDRAGSSTKQGRNRKRRTSADIERDRLVEEILRESKLDVYDEPEEEPQDGDMAADDRIAEQFRRDFYDAIQTRRRARPAKTAKTASKTEAPKGPKLGGSRSARAAMRESQAKAARK